MIDLSKRANLHGVREVRGVLTANVDAPDGVTGADWGVDLRLADSSDENVWTYAGEASVVEAPYVVHDLFGEFTETIREGAFKRTLGNDPLVSFVWMHDMGTVMAQTRGKGLVLGADPHLSVSADVQRSDPDAQRLEAKSRAGLASAMSFAFRVTDQTWNDDYTERDILAVELHGGDVSAIATGHGANPAASGQLRAVLDVDEVMRFLEAASLDDEQRSRLGAAITFTDPEDPEVPQSIREDFARLFALMVP